MMVVCTLTQQAAATCTLSPDLLPFVLVQVGKPGSSKSLALRLIHANLRGPDSSDEFFRRLPAVSSMTASCTATACPGSGALSCL